MKKDYIFKNVRTFIPGKDKFELTNFDEGEKWDNKQIKSVIIKGGGKMVEFFNGFFRAMEKDKEGYFFSYFADTITFEGVGQEPTVSIVENEKVILEFNSECFDSIITSNNKKYETPSPPIEITAKSQDLEIKPKENTKKEEISANKSDLVNEKINPKNNFWQIVAISSLVIIGLVGIIILRKKTKKAKKLK